MKRTILLTLFLAFGFLGFASSENLNSRLDRIMGRPEFKHAQFGIEFYSLDKQKPIYAHNADKFFTAASTTKLITCGSAMELFGADYRFQTRVYRAGELLQDGTLQGNLVLVASGDPNLSGRIQKDGTLAFENEDHSYGGEDSRGVPGDPLAVIRELAAQIAAKNVKRITGSVLVDASLFAQGERELGTGVVMSPIVVNDNLVDVIVGPGNKEGDPIKLTINPVTSYVRFVNEATSAKEGAKSSIQWSSDVENSDGSRTVTVSGEIALGEKTAMNSYVVPDPTRYAEIVFTDALREKGIMANPRLKEDKPDFKALSASYIAERSLAEHLSPPMTEEIKVVLKVSQNLHASLMPYLLSALVAKKPAPQAGFDLIHDFLTKARLDISGASQNDGAGGAAHFTPEFMVSYLRYMSQHKNHQAFYDALPILGKDGTLFNIQVDSPAAGQVHAKTGTWGDGDMLNKGGFVGAKGLAGYVTTRRGEHLAFAIYVNNLTVPDEPDIVRKIAGQAVGEIAAAAYDAQ